MRHDRGTPNVTPTPSPRSWAPPAAARVSSDAAEGLRSLRRDERFVRRASTAGRPLYAVDATRDSVPRRGLPRGACACPLLARYYNKLYATGTSAGAATRYSRRSGRRTVNAVDLPLPPPVEATRPPPATATTTSCNGARRAKRVGAGAVQWRLGGLPLRRAFASYLMCFCAIYPLPAAARAPALTGPRRLQRLGITQ